MKKKILDQIIEKKKNKEEFAIITNLKNGDSEIFELGKSLNKEFINYIDQVENFFKLKKNGIIEGTEYSLKHM